MRKAGACGHVAVIYSIQGRLTTLLAIAAMLADCGDATMNAPTTRIAARVNGAPITAAELDAAMPQSLKGSPDTSTATSATVLQQIIATELLVQKARDAKVDRDPQVMLAMQDARRAVLANEWLRQAASDGSGPSDQDVRDYFLQHADLFSGRRAYTIRLVEVQASMNDLPKLQEQLAKTRNLDTVLDYLRAGNRQFHINQLSKNSEELSADLLQRFKELKDGDMIAFSNGDHVDLVQMMSARAAAIDESQARQLIQKTLVELRTTKRAEAAVSSLRASAKIEIVGDFNSPGTVPTNGVPTVREIQDGIATGIK